MSRVYSIACRRLSVNGSPSAGYSTPRNASPSQIVDWSSAQSAWISASSVVGAGVGALVVGGAVGAGAGVVVPGAGSGTGAGAGGSPVPNQSQPQITHVAMPPSMLIHAW